MDLSTTYLGLKLSHPLMPGASPMVDDLDTVRRLEDAGAAAIVLQSLFEEQILSEQFREVQDVEVPEETFAEALTYHPRKDEYSAIGPDQYLARVRQIKEAVENRVIEATQAVRSTVKIPIAIKLSPFFSSLPNLVKRLEEAGADGVVLFNRFYQPDIDAEELEVVPKLRLSDSSELLLRLHWLAILSGRVNLSLAATGGIHTTMDAVKTIMAGAHGVQMVSALLKNGPDYLRKVRDGMVSWLEKHEYDSVDQMRGSMSFLKSPDPAAFERVNYMRILQGGTKEV